MEDQCAQAMPDTKRQKIWKAYRFVINKAKWWGFVAKWRTLHFLGLGWAYSRFLCKRGLYRKFPDGRCQWCGRKHA